MTIKYSGDEWVGFLNKINELYDGGMSIDKACASIGVKAPSAYSAAGRMGLRLGKGIPSTKSVTTHKQKPKPIAPKKAMGFTGFAPIDQAKIEIGFKNATISIPSNDLDTLRNVLNAIKEL